MRNYLITIKMKLKLFVLLLICSFVVITQCSKQLFSLIEKNSIKREKNKGSIFGSYLEKVQRSLPKNSINHNVSNKKIENTHDSKKRKNSHHNELMNKRKKNHKAMKYRKEINILKKQMKKYININKKLVKKIKINKNYLNKRHHRHHHKQHHSHHHNEDDN